MPKYGRTSEREREALDMFYNFPCKRFFQRYNFIKQNLRISLTEKVCLKVTNYQKARKSKIKG